MAAVGKERLIASMRQFYYVSEGWEIAKHSLTAMPVKAQLYF